MYSKVKPKTKGSSQSNFSPQAYSDRRDQSKLVQSIKEIEKKIGEVNSQITTLDNTSPSPNSIKSINTIKQHINTLAAQYKTEPKAETTDIMQQMKEFLNKQRKNNKIESPSKSLTFSAEDGYNSLLQSFKMNNIEENNKPSQELKELPKMQQSFEYLPAKMFYNKKPKTQEKACEAPIFDNSESELLKKVEILSIENEVLKQKLFYAEKEKESLRSEVVKLDV